MLDASEAESESEDGAVSSVVTNIVRIINTRLSSFISGHREFIN